MNLFQVLNRKNIRLAHLMGPTLVKWTMTSSSLSQWHFSRELQGKCLSLSSITFLVRKSLWTTKTLLQIYWKHSKNWTAVWTLWTEHFLFSRLDRFPDNLGDVSDEQWYRFHQVIEEWYQGRWHVNVMAYYCWSVKIDWPDAKHTRKSRNRKFLPWLAVWKFFYQSFVLKQHVVMFCFVWFDSSYEFFCVYCFS